MAELKQGDSNLNSDYENDYETPDKTTEQVLLKDTLSSNNTDQMIFTGERFVPEIDDRVMQMEHLQRYLSVCKVIKKLNVLDVACGEGYGSNLMANYAKNVTGVDISQDAINHAKKRYKRNNLNYIWGSATDLSMFQNESFDAVISFETIEHIDETSQQLFLKEIKRVLRPNGFLIMSTPDKKIYSDLHNYHNEYHIHEFYKSEFVSFLKSQFDVVNLFNQYFEVTGIVEEESIEKPIIDNVVCFRNNRKVEGKYLIAIASDSKVATINIPSIYMNPECEYDGLVTRVVQLQKEVEERNIHIHNLDDHIAQLNDRIVHLQKEVEERNIHIHNLDDHIAQLQDEINKMNNRLHPIKKLLKK